MKWPTSQSSGKIGILLAKLEETTMMESIKKRSKSRRKTRRNQFEKAAAASHVAQDTSEETKKNFLMNC